MARYTQLLGRWDVWSVLAGVILMLGPAPVSANFQMDVEYFITDSGGNIIGGLSQQMAVPVTDGTFTFSGAVTNEFTVAATVLTTNSPGSPTGANLQMVNVTIATLGGYAAGDTITILASAQGYTSPQSPPPLSLSAGATALDFQGASASYTFQGFADTNDQLFGTTGPSVTSTLLQTFTSPQATVPDTSTLFSPGGSSYSLTDAIGVAFNASGGGSTLTGELSNLSAVPTPTPAGIVLALTGLPLLGLGLLVRRRKVA